MIYTSYFASPKIRGLDSDTLVSVARTEPKGYAGKKVAFFAPSWKLIDIWKVKKDWPLYTKIYTRDYLAHIDVSQAGTKFQNKVLLCWENLAKPGEHCHRELIASWLQSNGFAVEEL